ncbi:BA14K-like protein [Mesorhizobium sp. J18]|uniref:BA14K family protein n=1 Tax=Mesorhizobium sp. J18 TaxID=935263 RepID=UPI00119C5E9C|nr:BA14K family protein [Mesorhizobium sp. J18]TWG95491.1 BA14K-like protein [Mesorhizobium sp. J18]
MKPLLEKLCIGTVVLSVIGSSILPAAAVPVITPPVAQAEQQNVIKVQNRRDRRQFRRELRRDRREYRREVRRDRRAFYRRGDHYYYHGHRGYRHYRPGYRQYNGWWFPAAAFVAGAIVGGAVSSTTPSYGNAHVQWCYNRYRSYRASDNTFQPYSGPRRPCISPYS